MRDRPKTAFAATVLVYLIASGLVFAQQTADRYQSPPENLPRSVPKQPIPFSHKLHGAQGMECVDCHRTAAKKFQAGLPQPKDCMLCHRTIAAGNPAIVKMRRLMSAGLGMRWVPVYDSPSFVFFSHKKHVKAGEACETCHGDVTQYDVLVQEVSINMTACMNCHEQKGVENACFWCHDLGQ